GCFAPSPAPVECPAVPACPPQPAQAQDATAVAVSPALVECGPNRARAVLRHHHGFITAAAGAADLVATGDATGRLNLWREAELVDSFTIDGSVGFVDLS